MSNGLGAGFFAITLLAVLAGLASFVIVTTIASAVYHRRTGNIPMGVRYLFGVICVGVLGATGFGILLLSDEAPAVAWLFTSIVILPFLIVSGYLAHTTGLSRLDILTTTVMAWGIPFFLGVIVTFGAMNGIESVFNLAPAASRQSGVAWIAATTGGLTIILSMILISDRLGRMVQSVTTS